MAPAYHIPFNVFNDATNPIVPPNPDGSGAVAVSGANVSYPGRTMGALGGMNNAAAHMSVTSGSPTGTVYLQVSNDPRCADPVLQFTTAQWVTLRQIPVVAGNVEVPGQTPDANGMEVWPNGARYFRLVYINASGSGTMTFWVSGTGN